MVTVVRGVSARACPRIPARPYQPCARFLRDAASRRPTASRAGSAADRPIQGRDGLATASPAELGDRRRACHVSRPDVQQRRAPGHVPHRARLPRTREPVRSARTIAGRSRPPPRRGVPEIELGLISSRCTWPPRMRIAFRAHPSPFSCLPAAPVHDDRERDLQIRCRASGDGRSRAPGVRGVRREPGRRSECRPGRLPGPVHVVHHHRRGHRRHAPALRGRSLYRRSARSACRSSSWTWYIGRPTSAQFTTSPKTVARAFASCFLAASSSRRRA
jgi:hypothetical protein